MSRTSFSFLTTNRIHARKQKIEKDKSWDSEDAQSQNKSSNIKRSLIHAYFSHDKTIDLSKCNSCTATIKGSNTTNLENHLKIRKHKHNEYLQYLNDKENAAQSCNPRKIARAKAKSLLQPTFIQLKCYRAIFFFLTSHSVSFFTYRLQKKEKYARKNVKQLLLRKKLAFCVATTSMTTSTCENKDWQ